MLEQRRPLPESIRGLVNIASRAYRRRFALYFGTAFAGLMLQGIVAYLRPADEGLQFAGSIALDSLVAVLVTVGIVTDLNPAERVPNGAIASRALERWGVVAVVTTLVDIVTTFTSSAVIGPPAQTAYGFLLLPIAVAWGSLAFASVIAAVDEKMPAHILVLAALGRSVALALARPNIGRLIALALVAVLPTLVQAVLSDQLELRKVAAWQFISTVPIDALVTGPLQAVFTIFYLDFVRRAGGPRAESP